MILHLDQVSVEQLGEVRDARMLERVWVRLVQRDAGEDAIPPHHLVNLDALERPLLTRAAPSPARLANA